MIRRLLLGLLLAHRKRKIKRLIKCNRELDAAIEAATGEPIKLTPEEKSRLRAKAKGIPREELKKISTFDIYDDDD